MYFESRIRGRRGLPWFDSRSDWQKASDAYFEKLEDVAAEVDSVENATSFISELYPDDFDSGYQFVAARIGELRNYLRHDDPDGDPLDLLNTLDDISDSLKELKFDASLYDNGGDDDFGNNDDFASDDTDDNDDTDDDADDAGSSDLDLSSDWDLDDSSDWDSSGPDWGLDDPSDSAWDYGHEKDDYEW